MNLIQDAALWAFPWNIRATLILPRFKKSDPKLARKRAPNRTHIEAINNQLPKVEENICFEFA